MEQKEREGERKSADSTFQTESPRDKLADDTTKSSTKDRTLDWDSSEKGSAISPMGIVSEP